jgi:hypothetical protein
MSTMRADKKTVLRPGMVACSAATAGSVSDEAAPLRDTGSNGVELRREPPLDTSCVQEHRFLPVEVQAQDGRRVLRRFQSRWTSTQQGQLESVEMLCPDCSSSLIVQDLPLRVARMFACQLTCPECSRGVIACGSKRTLLMALRLIINEGGSSLTDASGSVGPAQRGVSGVPPPDL